MVRLNQWKTWVFCKTDNVAENPTFIKCTITGNETGVYKYDHETVQRSNEYRIKKVPKPKKPNFAGETKVHRSRDFQQVYGKLD